MPDMYYEAKPYLSELALKKYIPVVLGEFAIVERVYSNFTAMVINFNEETKDGLFIPTNLGAKKGKKIRGRIPILQRGQLVYVQYFDSNKDSGVIVSCYPVSFDNNKELNTLYDILEKDKVDYTEEFFDIQEDYRINYKKDRYYVYDISEKKEVFSFKVKDKQIYFGDSESSSDNKKVVINLTKDEKISVGKGDMSAVSLDELKDWMDDVKDYFDEIKDWMDDVKDNVKGIMDALKNGSVAPTDGGATYKSTVSASLASVKQPDTVEPPEFPDKKKLGDTNIKISKKGS